MCNILGNNSLGNVVYNWSGWQEFAILVASEHVDLLGNNCCLKLMHLAQLVVTEEVLSDSNCLEVSFDDPFQLLLCHSTMLFYWYWKGFI